MPASSKVLAVSAEVAPHDFNFDMIIFLQNRMGFRLVCYFIKSIIPSGVMTIAVSD